MVPYTVRWLPLLFLAAALFACDPLPQREFVPPGGYARETSVVGRSAIRAVLFTPGHGYFRTVREAVKTYMGEATAAVRVDGWYAYAETQPIDRYVVRFAWTDGALPRYAEWELNRAGVWPTNREAEYLSVYPPEDGSR